MFRCQVCASPEPVRTRQHTFDVFCCIAAEFHDRLKAEGYAADPVIQHFTGISISELQDLRDNKSTIVNQKVTIHSDGGTKCSPDTGEPRIH